MNIHPLHKELRKMSFDINKIQTEFDKAKKSLEAKNKAIFDAMKSCSNCKETDTQFIPCKTHLDQLKAVGEEMADLQLHTQLKVQMHPAEMQKIMDAQMKIMAEQMKSQKQNKSH
jgi:hypothetical protein